MDNVNIKTPKYKIEDLYEDMCDLFANEINKIFMKEGESIEK